MIPVIDLFAGPGGLGEGFSAFLDSGGQRVFKVGLSIEMAEAAHSTLELRSFFRQFPRRNVPKEYYLHLRGQLSRERLFSSFEVEATAAKAEAWRAELGKVDSKEVDCKIKRVIDGSEKWVLCGGPPCQAYSVIGRSRNGGIDADDHRVYLYKEYLRILSVHGPPVFIMENVKGLLSSQVGDNEIFRQMLADLHDPGVVVKGSRRKGPRYLLYSLVKAPTVFDLAGNPECKPRDFVIKSEEYAVPQSRHRLIILGIREDMTTGVIPILQPLGRQIPAGRVLRGLPRLRSGLTRTTDGKAEWRDAVMGILTDGILDEIPNGSGRLLRRDIAWTLQRFGHARANRGAEFIPCTVKSDYEPKWFCDPRIGGICNHVSRPHMVNDLYRYLFAACYAKLFGRSPELRDFPPNLLPKHRNVKDNEKLEYFDDRFRVQLANKPSTTVTSHLAKDGHYFIHYDETQCRSLTVREAARLQTFPDNYYFCGPRTHQYVQVGNAVPPLLARQIAAVVFRVLSESFAGCMQASPGSR